MDGERVCLRKRSHALNTLFQVCRAGTPRFSPAVLHTALVWRSSFHLETGNYVPTGSQAPTRMPESRMCVTNLPTLGARLTPF